MRVLITNLGKTLDDFQALIDEWNNHSIRLQDVLKLNLFQFALYLSASDGMISYTEMEVVSLVWGSPYSPEAARNYLKSNNIYSTEFEQKVPEIFQASVQLDNQMEERGIKMNETLTDCILETYKVTANLILMDGGETTEEEKEDFFIYYSMLESYLNANLRRRKIGIPTGIKKNTKKVMSGTVAPSKNGGVVAPKKDEKVSAPKKGK